MHPNPWQDTKQRVVSLNILRNMCADMSQVAHRFEIVSESAHRVVIEYSNPDEYGNENDPIRASFVCWRESRDMVCVLLNIVRITGGRNWHGEQWQAFDVLLDYPSRNPNAAKAA